VIPSIEEIVSLLLVGDLAKQDAIDMLYQHGTPKVLRDEFAAAALQTAFAKAQHNLKVDGDTGGIKWSLIVASAYDCAEEMLKERDK